MPGLDETRPFIPVGIAVLTVSDTRTLADDRSGDTLAARIKEAGHRLVDRAIVPDDRQAIASRVKAWTERDDIDVVITTGGTGFTGRDVTPEALEPLFEKRMDGFGEAFRRLSWEEIGPRAILSRATAGVVGGLVVYSLPGSPKAVRLGVRTLIAPTLEHAVDLAQGRTAHAHSRPMRA